MYRNGSVNTPYVKNNYVTLHSTDTHFEASKADTFENIVGKGEIARNEQFLFFPQCFLLYRISVSPFFHMFDIMYLFAVELEEFKFGISGKGLIHLTIQSPLAKITINTTLKEEGLSNIVVKENQC